jgi:hypothetical protein
MHFLTRKRISRRTLLRGAGAALALPLMETMLPWSSAKAAEATALRLACIYVPHGAVMSRWTPDAEGTAFELKDTLKPLAKFRDSLNIVSGMSLPLASGKDASAGANHTRSSAVFLTGAEPGEGGEARLGVSFDQVVAGKIGQGTPLPSLELAIEDGGLNCGSGLSCAYRNTIAWQTPVSPLPMENNPQIVFERLFGDGTTEELRVARRRQTRSLLDAIASDVPSLQKQLSSGDRDRLDRYLTDVREVERRIELASRDSDHKPVLPDAPSGIPESFDAHVKLLFDLQVLAWQSDVTRVTTLMFAKEVSNAVYAESGVREPFHNLSHHSNQPDNIARLAQLNQYHARMVGYLLEKLQATPDGDSNLLHNSLVLYGSGMSNSNQHDHDPLPVLLAGRLGGRLAGGRHIRTPQGTPLSNLQFALLQKFGVDAKAFGDSNGAISL